MRFRSLPLLSFALVSLLSASALRAQFSSSSYVRSTDVSWNQRYAATGTAAQDMPSGGRVVRHEVRPFSALGFDIHAGLRGAGFNVATPLARKFNLRAGADFLSGGSSFAEEGADVVADLRLRSGHASFDWYPFGSQFRLSPQVVFANSSSVQATALIPAGGSITLNGGDYISSTADPLHGSGSVDFRKVAPGFSLGFGNIVRRSKGHWTVPFEAGFYYVGQPRLRVAFTGSACDPNLPQAIGCQSVNSDAGFKADLAAFIKRNNNNLSYASFLPILSVGVGYRF